MPGQGLVEAAHALAEVGEASIELRVGRDAQGLVGVGFLVERQGLFLRLIRGPDPEVERPGLSGRPAALSTRLSR